MSAGAPLPRAFLAAIIAIGLAIVSGQYVPARFDYTIAGAVLASLLLFFRIARLADRHHGDLRGLRVGLSRLPDLRPVPLAWTLLVVTTAVVAVIVARYPRPRAMLLLVTWLAVASAFRYLLPPSGVGREAVTMLTVFVFLALVMSLMLFSRRREGD